VRDWKHNVSISPDPEYAWGGTLDFGVLKTLITATRVLLGGHMHPVKGRHADGGTAVDGGTYHPL
jgi:hypothetical protein